MIVKVNVPEQICEAEVEFQDFLRERSELEMKDWSLTLLNELSNPEDVIYEFFDENDFCLDDYIKALPKNDLKKLFAKIANRMAKV